MENQSGTETLIELKDIKTYFYHDITHDLGVIAEMADERDIRSGVFSIKEVIGGDIVG